MINKIPPSSYPKRQEDRVLYAPLFQKSNSFVQKSLIALDDIITQVLHQTHSQKTDLKYAIRDLSAMLTRERVELTTPYWATPRLFAAYISFFMPWNLVRLTQLLPSLELPDMEENDVILDLGSGPLTFPIALFISNTKYRETPLNIYVSDVNAKTMEVGKEILLMLAEALNIPMKWNIILMRKNFLQAVKHIPTSPKLIFSGNVLNEQESKEALQKSTTEELFTQLLETIQSKLHPQGAYLAIEPGTRQGGRLISTLRETAIALNFYPYAPCTHNNVCPIYNNQRVKTWCHCQCPAIGPAWLKFLSKSAGLERENLTLSFILLKTFDEGSFPNIARILSNPFPIQNNLLARYGCTDRGLVLLTNAERVPHSSLAPIELSRKRDRKSGAFMARIVVE